MDLTNSGPFPSTAIWSAVGKPLTGIGGGRYYMDTHHLFFERGTLRTESQQVELTDVVDVDLKQALAQKARGLASLQVKIQRPTGVETVAIDDIPDGRAAQAAINDAARSARLAAQRVQNTVHYTGGSPVTAAPPGAPAGGAGDVLLEQLAKLAGLREAGALDDAEFAAAKAKLLA